MCDLESGSYTTSYLQPGLTYTVPSAGWGSLNREASPGNFHLFPPGATLAGFNDGTSDGITMLSAVVPPGVCNGAPSSEYEHTFEGLVEFLTTNPHLAVSHVHTASVGGLEGTVMDIAYATSDGCPDGDYADEMVGASPSHGAFGITSSVAGQRVYLLHNPNSELPMAVVIDDAADGSDYGDGDDWYGPAQSVIDSFVFIF